MLMSEEAGTEVVLQLHQVQLQLWDARGVVLAGTEVHWNRKRSDSYPQSWFIGFPKRSDTRACGAGADLAARTCRRGGATVWAVGADAHRLSMGHFEEAGDVPHPGI